MVSTISPTVLRDYQTEAVNAVLRAFRSYRSAIVVMPTGTGKTTVFGELCRIQEDGECLVLAHRAELVDQAAKRIEGMTGLPVSIEMASQRANHAFSLFGEPGRTTVASVQSLSRAKRLARYDPHRFSLVVIDEAHRAAAKTYRELTRHFLKNENCRILGVTATPDRLDGLGLRTAFETVAYTYELTRAIDDGYLVPIHQRMVTIEGLDLSHVRTASGDLIESDLDRLFGESALVHRIAAACHEVVGERKAIVFCPGVDSANAVATVWNRLPGRHGQAASVTGKTPKDQRRKALAAFKDGTLRCLVGCDVFTEGYDEPSVQVVVMAAPTKSRSKYAQRAGRGTRPLEGWVDPGQDTSEARRAAIAASAKSHCEIVDLVGDSGRHKLITTLDILAGDMPEHVRRRVVERAKKEACDVLRVSREDMNRHVYARAAVDSRTVNPFDYSDAPVAAAQAKDRIAASNRRVLIRNGINPDALSKKEADIQVARIKAAEFGGPATNAQRETLKRNGVSADNLDRGQASAILDMIVANNWAIWGRERIEPKHMSIRITGNGYYPIFRLANGRTVFINRPHISEEACRKYMRRVAQACNAAVLGAPA